MHAAVDSSLPHVFSAAELARATRTSLAEVQAWIEAGAIRPLPVGDGITWLTRDEALRAGRAVLDGTIASQVKIGTDGNALFAPTSGSAALSRLRDAARRLEHRARRPVRRAHRHRVAGPRRRLGDHRIARGSGSAAPRVPRAAGRRRRRRWRRTEAEGASPESRTQGDRAHRQPGARAASSARAGAAEGGAASATGAREGAGRRGCGKPGNARWSDRAGAAGGQPRVRRPGRRGNRRRNRDRRRQGSRHRRGRRRRHGRRAVPPGQRRRAALDPSRGEAGLHGRGAPAERPRRRADGDRREARRHGRATSACCAGSATGSTSAPSRR